ncbi:hypothetical protein [uncultured Sphaerochaeta sp.]|uniref:hypothetical protein n=1 Tax=uncultured Sphaerochaeta sp. TaxID=886478 RepID=UPI002AA6EAEE|nr:hypothetical protein [uncultured Sphaerochaeta sp.]
MRYRKSVTNGLFFVLLLMLIMLMSGCTSFMDISATQSLYKGAKYQGAYESLLLEAPSLLKKQGPIIVNYDLGILSRLGGNYSDSNNYLSESERLIWEAYTESVSGNIASFLVNDNTKAYQGEEYEDMYLNVFKALNYIHLGETEAALVELNRSIEKQTFLKQKYEQYEQQMTAYAREEGLDAPTVQTYATAFSTSALSNYLSASVAQALGEDNTLHFAIDQVRHAFSSQPSLYPFPLPSVVELEEDPFPQDMGRLHLVSFSGQSPLKEERVERVYVSSYNRAKIAYPVLVGGSSQIQAVRVSIEGQPMIPLQRIESISNIAIDTFRAKSELIKMKAITRAMAKAVGIALYDEYAAQDNNVTAGEELLGMIFRIARDATESADVRSTHFLPSEAWVGYVDLPEGTYIITTEFLNASNQVLHRSPGKTVQVQAGSLHVAEAFCPL